MTVRLPPPSDPNDTRRRSRRGRHARRGPVHAADGVVAGVLAATIVFHVAVLVARGSPTGVDFGNWLFFGHQALGNPVGADTPTTYPPLIPVVSVWATALFGPLWANATVMATAGVAPAAGLYAAARLCGVRWSALPATVLLAVTASTGEAIAWGGAPQAAGLGFAALALGFTVRLARRRNLRAAVGLSAAVFALAVTSHLVLAQFVVAFVVLVVLIALVARPDVSAPAWRGRDGWIACGAVVVGPLAALIPLYVRLATTAGGALETQGTPRGWPTLRVFLENLWAVYREAPWIWKSLVLLAVVSPLVTFGLRRREPLWLITTATVVAMLAQALVSTEERLVYFAPLPVLFALVLCTHALVATAPTVRWHRGLRTGLVTTLVAVTVYPGIRGVGMFADQVDFYGRLVPPGTVAGLDWIRDNTAGDALVLTAPIDGAPFGWWVQGYAQRPTLVASRDRWLNFPSERARARQAVGLLTTPDPLGDTTLGAARDAGVDYLVLPWAWGGLRPHQLEAFRRTSGDAIRFDNDALVVIEVPR